ncbi:DapH/DapD/GlmU-related protein [Clostridium lacusfryxellense]|uniref:DapH/DapD/GlmU-related protein n=1 Tax=Clostridium lacusfryxellense TaxID=205328 RepID=UPI001C0DAE5C|nr:DapH/DapD/GlmU-related protein [Clostridium lacusfryxellense]MBU3110763.1 transferase [Clostridium lacusfryxellense]
MKKFIAFIFHNYFATYLPSSDSKIMGHISKKIRGFLFKMYTQSDGNNINIQRKTIYSSKVNIGSNSGIGIGCIITGPTIIGNNVMMGPDVLIYTTNHETSDVNIPMCEQGFKTAKVVKIGNDVWIGARVIILPGVTIGDGVIIGSGTVVTKDVSPYVVFAGNPGRVVKNRKQLRS